MTILLTGGSGFLGSHVAEQLSLAGREVRALVRESSDTRFLRTLEHVTLVEGAVDDPESLREAVAGVTAVIHAAGLVKARSLAEFYRVNAGGTANLLRAVRQSGTPLRRFVYVSSLGAVGPTDADGTPVTRATDPHPVTRYGRSKLAGEHACREHQDEIPITILRPAAIYGPRDREILPMFKAIGWSVKPTMGSAEAKVSMVYGPDAATASISAIDADVPSGSAYFVDDGSVYTFSELVAAAEKALGKRAWLGFGLPRPMLRAAATAVEFYGKATNRAVMFTPDKCNELFAQWVCDSGETPEALGWRAKVLFPEGARITAEWYRREGWL
jgi:nucleoside-diphosphate-sugar epimerase